MSFNPSQEDIDRLEGLELPLMAQVLMEFYAAGPPPEAVAVLDQIAARTRDQYAACAIWRQQHNRTPLKENNDG